ncbi:hypothetical protein ASG67_00620 [Sphingomonas sp. Leaf339]|uniref:STAS/SEC14 domain-containing protein n=1 Tax=Sphingomonas sp. Leaf339 TaxID=1736343 RepID=UPI0006F57388|nr:STAS/SEC14 domain-containing protein [Sphingomonas sp. Leaf339]KQU61730.1 hypothetical protein ASG67_00620 [Sphingomonas sp. Leaf339]
MIAPTYFIEPDAANEFLRLTLTGDWDVAISQRFAADVARTLREMIGQGARPGHLRTLIDMRRKSLLPQNAAAEFAKMVRPDSPSKRIAMLVSGAIHRLQARRMSGERHQVFGSEEAAMAWLMDPSAPPRVFDMAAASAG